jgi:N-acetylneuraminate lyase
VNGFYVTGSTGECFLMTHAERTLTVRTVVEQVAGRVPVIAHVGDIGTKRSIMLAEQAGEAGVDAVSAVPPFYFRFDAEAIVRYYRDLAGATELPMLIYNISLAGMMGAELILRLAELDNVRGMKYTGFNHAEMGFLKRQLGPDFVLFSGADEMALSGLSVGATGLIGSFYNAMPETFLRLYQAMGAGDLATASRLQAIATDVILATLKYDLQPVLRNLLAWQGCDAGYSARPFRAYVDEELVGLKADLRAIRDRHQVSDEVELLKYV